MPPSPRDQAWKLEPSTEPDQTPVSPGSETQERRAFLSPAELAAFKGAGYTVARRVLSAAEIDELRAACDELVARAQGFAQDTFVGTTFFNIHRNANPFAKDLDQVPTVPGQIRRVTYPYALSNVLNRFRAHPALLGLVAQILGPDLKQIVNQVNFNPPGAGIGWGWHQDYRFRKPGIRSLQDDFVQTIIAIDPCTEYTGGLRVIPESHKLGSLQLDIDNEHAERFFDASKAVTPELAPGDVILFNSHLIHGSSANRSPNQRRVYINGYARATATTGMPVLVAGVPTDLVQGRMEYEGDRVSLPKASKY